MGVHLEVQDEREVIQLRSRELQMENTEKLDTLIPVVETINNVDLNKIENSTTEIKNIVSNNLEDQVDLDDILKEIQKVNKNVSSLKSQITKLNKKVEEIESKVKK